MSPQASHSSHQTATTRAARRRASLHAILLATSALASAALPTAVAHADDAIWLATQPADGDAGNFNNATHWNNGVPDGIATFNASDTRAIKFSAGTPLDGITLTAGAGDYTFDTQDHGVSIDGAGFSIQSGASLTYINTNGITFFNDASKAGEAHIINNGGTVDFSDTSKAENASITSDGENAVIFFDSGASGD